MKRLINIILPVMVVVAAAYGFAWFNKQSAHVEIDEKYIGMRSVFGPEKTSFKIVPPMQSLQGLKQDDIVAYQLPGEDAMAGRIVGLPGQTIGRGRSVPAEGLFSGDVFRKVLGAYPPFTVPYGCVMLTQDGRGPETDSRTIGAVPARFIRGKIP